MLESFGVVWALVTANYEIVLGIVVAVVALLVVSAFVLIGSRSRLPARLARVEHDVRVTRQELAAIREALVALRKEMRAEIGRAHV